jgi:signal transduction histidine kinase
VLHLVAQRARADGADDAFIALPREAPLLCEVATAPAPAAAGTRCRWPTAPAARSSPRRAQLLLGEARRVLAGSGRSALVCRCLPRGARGQPPGAPAARPAGVTELTGFAAQATLGLEVAERRRDAERLVVFEDRDRIARDLHDLVIQRLFATGMQLESAARLIERPDAASRVRRSVDDLDTTIREIRSTIYALQNDPSEQDRSSLRSRLFEVVDAGAEQLGFAPSVRLSGLVDTSVPPGLADHLLAVLREALSNAARHAGAARVEVVLEVDDEVSWSCRDDGAGRTTCPQQRAANLAERAARGGRSRAARPERHRAGLDGAPLAVVPLAP